MMYIQYIACDFYLWCPDLFPYISLFPYPGMFPYPGLFS